MAPKRRTPGSRRPARRRTPPSRTGGVAAWRAMLRRGKALGPRLARLPRIAWVLIAVVLLGVTNYVVQVVRKPTELLGLVFAPSPLAVEQTWARYEGEVRENSTDLVRPELLAALIQVESSGDPLARTYWRWQWTTDPSRLYGPASSAVGLLQITDGTFDAAAHYCVADHRVLRDDGPFLESCWFNGLYFRTVPGHAIEMTAALLHVQMVETLGAARAAALPAARRDAVAAVIHLCGAGRVAAFAANGFRARAGERCGDHDLRDYVERVRALTARFEKLSGDAR